MITYTEVLEQAANSGWTSCVPYLDAKLLSKINFRKLQEDGFIFTIGVNIESIVTLLKVFDGHVFEPFLIIGRNTKINQAGLMLGAGFDIYLRAEEDRVKMLLILMHARFNLQCQ